LRASKAEEVSVSDRALFTTGNAMALKFASITVLFSVSMMLGLAFIANLIG
jgi:hypothetical protein